MPGLDRELIQVTMPGLDRELIQVTMPGLDRAAIGPVKSHKFFLFLFYTWKPQNTQKYYKIICSVTNFRFELIC